MSDRFELRGVVAPTLILLVMAGCGVVTVTMAFLARRASARAPQPNWASR